jgi:HPt (histidine-containing phosphotransfer) domain-containing protein
MHDVFDPTMIELLVDDIGENPAREVLRLFFKDWSEKLGRLCGESASPDAKTAQRYAHSLKSAAAAFGFKSLSLLAQSLEAEAYDLTGSEIAARAQGLNDALARARGFSRLQ